MVNVDPSQWTYTDYVCFLRAHGFHNLGLLDEYLQWGAAGLQSHQVRQPQPSRVNLLEFGKNGTRIADLSDMMKLRLLLKEWQRPVSDQSAPKKGPTGRIVMVEDINPALVDTLGGLLNIYPTFFASHLDDPGFSNTPDASSSPALPSAATRSQKDFFTIEYISAFTPLGCSKEVEGLPLQCKGNYFRRIELIQKQGKQKMALARRKISFCFKAGDPWLCIVLVDPPLSTFSIGSTNFNAITPSQIFECLPYSGGYLDFIEMRKPISRQHHDFRDCRHRGRNPSIFDDLVRHWQIQARDGLFRGESNLAIFMRPAFQIAASECGNFFAYLRASLESQSSLPPTITDPARTRRCLDKCIFIDSLLSRYKLPLQRMKDFVHPCPDLKDDFRQLLLDLHHYRAECDSQMQHITSILQNHESSQIQTLSKESMRRADYLRYLVIIALIYAPFAIACAVFTMPHEFVPAAHYLYGFLPVTAVVTLLFLLLVLPESRDSWPSLKAAMCGKLTRERLLAKQRPDSSYSNGKGGSSKRLLLEEV